MARFPLFAAALFASAACSAQPQAARPARDDRLSAVQAQPRGLVGQLVRLGLPRDIAEGVEIDLSGDWRTVAVHELVSEAVGESVTPDTGADRLRQIAQARQSFDPALFESSLVEHQSGLRVLPSPSAP